MYKYLLDHAIKNIWCNPKQDNEFIIKAHKITKPVGSINIFKLMERTIDLPTKGIRYHVYNVGQVHPRFIGLLKIGPSWYDEKWTSFSTAMTTSNLIAILYTDLGAYVPRFNSYYFFSKERDLIIAIPTDKRLSINFETEDIYLRLYTNAFFKSSLYNSNSNDDMIFSTGDIIEKTADRTAIIALYNTYKAKTYGYVFTYVNGFKVNKLSVDNIKNDDIVEFVYDSSVKHVATFTVKNLKTFTSIKDQTNKYILHYAGTVNTIDYHDDIEIDIVREGIKTGGYHSLGYYYNRNSLKSHRMLTHRDYSIIVNRVNTISNKVSSVVTSKYSNFNYTAVTTSNFRVEVKIRRSGYDRALCFENNRIFELYKLNDSLIVAAMTGTNSTVSVWKAENLEMSGYTTLMSAKYSDINIDLIKDAYGYNAISKILGETPTKTILDSNRQLAIVPIGLCNNFTAFEYNANGELLESNYYDLDTYYYARNSLTTMVEAIYGKGTYRPDVFFGTNNITLPINNNYRVYLSHLVNGTSDNSWIDVTNTNNYNVVNGVLKNNGSVTNAYFMVISDRTFLHYTIDLTEVSGCLFFTLSEEVLINGNYINVTLPIPFGELDIWLNGKSLIRDLDYTIVFPKVYINNRNFLTQPANTNIQKVVVRFTGFCTSDLKMDEIEDHGFIEHGFLSNNKKHDIRDDKVLRITVNGGIKHRSDVKFSEEHNGISIINSLNGQPYQIKDVVVPFRHLVNGNTYEERQKSIDIDNEISDYLTLYKPQSVRDGISSIEAKYPLVSPFIANITNDLIEGIIDNEDIDKTLSDNQIINICKPYEYLLEFDPISSTTLDHDYVFIVPHNLDTVKNLNYSHYWFLLNVNRLYSKNLVDIKSSFVFSYY